MTATPDTAAPTEPAPPTGPAPPFPTATTVSRPGQRSASTPWDRFLRGRPDDPGYARPALLVLLGSTAVLYLWGLGASGWANAFYSAAAQAGTESWKAFFFGSSDAGNSITVDKTPLSLWVMALSARVFGVNSWSILVPQALMGVASVGLLYSMVRRWFTPAAGLIAGAVLALTPVAALMFRFNNPDAVLVLLEIAAVYATLRALERASTRWLALAGAFVGLAFMAKMLQALLVVPALALVYLIAAPTPLRRRLLQLIAALGALVLAGGWWVAAVQLIPAQYRPYIGGSQNNSVLELALGYNGLGRLTGNETGSVSGGRGWGETGLLRMFDAEIGGQIAWLLPAALLMLAAGLWVTRRAPRTDRTRAAFLVWGLWLVVTGLTFSLMAGIFHAYYTIALAPAIAALIGMGVAALWRIRRTAIGSGLLAVTLAVTAIWSWQLLGRSADFQPWLRPAVLIVGGAATVGLLMVGKLGRRAAAGVAAAGLVAALAGPAAYTLQTVSTAHTGAIPSAGPAVAGARFGPGGQRGVPGGAGNLAGGPAFAGPQGQAGPQGGFGGRQGGIQGGIQGGPGGAGGLLNAGTPSAALVSALQVNASSYAWVAAAVGANTAAGYQLASGESVMPVGGFNGSDPSPTLAQFQEYVAAGRIHYFIGGSGMRADSGSASSAQIAAWVQENFASTPIGGVTLYDLTQQGSSITT